jgi:transposase InsO family protein
MAHANARLTEFGRLLLVQRITELGCLQPKPPRPWACRGPRPTSGLAAPASRARPGWPTAARGPAAAPTRSPPPRCVGVLAARRRHRQGPHRLAWRLGMARSTIYGVLARHGQSRLDHTDRASGVVVRYQRQRPGELVHIDVKKLGRIPDGGGHRAHGRSATTPTGRGIGYDYIHSAVDDRSRVAFSQILPDESAATAALFLIEAASFFADHGVRIERVLTDNAKAYAQSILFAETAAVLGITLKRTRRYRPQTNGKVERFNRTLLEEWAYARLYRSNLDRQRAFTRWLRSYNHRRPHTSLDGLTPMAALVNNLRGKHI